MSMGYNKIQLVGRITHDLDLSNAKVKEEERQYSRFSLAVNGYNERVDFIDCIVWGDRAVNLVKYSSKGSKILVEGRVNISTYENEDGENRKSFTVIADNILYLDNKPKEEEKPKVVLPT